MQVLLFLLVAGIHYPILASTLGSLLIIARIAYTVGYVKHPKSRMPGIIMTNISTVSLFVVALMSIYEMIYKKSCPFIIWKNIISHITFKNPQNFLIDFIYSRWAILFAQ